MDVQLIMFIILQRVVVLCLVLVAACGELAKGRYKSGTYFELECPTVAIKQTSSMRTYALVLSNAQKNMEISVYVNKSQTNGKLQHSLLLTTIEPAAGSGALSQSNSTLLCNLNRTHKICVLDGFINQFRLSCSNPGSISLMVVEPAIVSQHQEGPIRERVVALVLKENEKAILKFKPDIRIDPAHNGVQQFFISNCIESISYFQQELMMGVRGTTSIGVVMTNDAAIGEWTLVKMGSILNQIESMAEAYAMPFELVHFEVEQQVELSKTIQTYHGIKLLLCSQNSTFLSLTSFNLTAKLKTKNKLFDQEELRETVEVGGSDLLGSVPPKLLFFYADHSIKSIALIFNSPVHFNIQVVTEYPALRASGPPTPVVEEDELLFYFVGRKLADPVPIELHLSRSYSTSMTAPARIKSQGVSRVLARPNYEHTLGKKDTSGDTTRRDGDGWGQWQIVSSELKPMRVSENSPYGEIELAIQMAERKGRENPFANSGMAFFKLMVEKKQEWRETGIGEEIKEYLFQNQQKRFSIDRKKMELVGSRKLKVICSKCLAYLTYNSSCTSTSCCQFAYSDRVPVKNETLAIFVRPAAPTHSPILIFLVVLEDQKAAGLQDGHIVEGVLENYETFTFESDGKDDLQILFNSQVQSILMLVMTSRNQFPTKNSFDHQSNEGYIRVGATKTKKTIFITLLKIVESYERSTNFRIPFSIVVVKQGSKLNLKEGHQFSHVLGRNSHKQYLLQHPCLPAERVYLKVSPKSHTSLIGASTAFDPPTLNIKIWSSANQSALVDRKITHSTIEITKLLVQSNDNGLAREAKLNVSTCSVVVELRNLLSETLSVTVMFFREKQSHQITTGQFARTQSMAKSKILLFCAIDPGREINVYAYSLREEISLKATVASLKQLKLMDSELQLLEEWSQSGLQQDRESTIKSITSSQRRAFSHSQFISIKLDAVSVESVNANNSIAVVIIQIFKTLQNENFQRNDIYVVCTQNQTILRVGERLQYKIEGGKKHSLYYPLSEELVRNQQKPKEGSAASWQSQNEKEIILQTTKLGGNFRIESGLKYYGKEVCRFNVAKTEGNRPSKSPTQFLSKQDPIIIIKSEMIRRALVDLAKEDKQISYNNLFVELEVSCVAERGKYCNFISTIQTSQSDIRELTLGVPQIFHINRHSSIVFVYKNNLRDDEFKFKVNRKLGFPNYKLCSHRPEEREEVQWEDKAALAGGEDQCLSDLRNSESEFNLRIEQNAFTGDSKLIVGRTHELIINQHSEHYCTNCTYYLGLYSDYDVVEGSIFVMSASQGTLLEEGASITTIVYRDEPDTFLILNWQSLMAIIYQIDGSVEVQAYYREGKDKKKVILINKTSSTRGSAGQEDGRGVDGSNIITIGLAKQKLVGGHHEYFLSVRPARNQPLALYTLVIMSREEQIINVKDGVPYEMKYSQGDNRERSDALNPIISYRYVCENQGIIMLSTRDFDDLGIELTCRDDIQSVAQGTGNFDNASSLQFEMGERGRKMDIQDLLKAKKTYKMSNRLDIAISPKLCSRYELKITSKGPSVSYKVLISSTDIITLPLNKEVPGVLKYQSKLYQIYEISISQKTDVRCTFKFCQGGEGRIMIAKSKKNVYLEIYESQMEINEDTSFEVMRYTAKPGLFYIKIQFKASGGVMQYTVHVGKEAKRGKLINENEGIQIKALQFPDGRNTIQHRIVRIGSNYTEYEIRFWPIVHNSQQYEIEYYIVESTKMKLLKKTENCNGQYFEQLVNHHEEIKQTKIDINLTSQVVNKDLKANQITFRYTTSQSYIYATIIPIVFNKGTHQFYHLYVPKYQQVYLTNGQIFSTISYVLSEIASRIEQVVDIHASEKALLAFITILLCLCVFMALALGIWAGRKYFFLTKTVYVLKEVRQSDIQEENVDDNRIQDLNNETQSAQIQQEQSAEDNIQLPIQYIDGIQNRQSIVRQI